KHFANNYGFNYNNLLQNKTIKKKGGTKDISHVLNIADSKQKNALYLINYKEGGFVIISGDKREGPILAYSENNQLHTTTTEQVPGGRAFWISQNVQRIEKLRNSKMKGTTRPYNGWQVLLNNKKGGTEQAIFPPIDGDPDDPGDGEDPGCE